MEVADRTRQKEEIQEQGAGHNAATRQRRRLPPKYQVSTIEEG